MFWHYLKTKRKNAILWILFSLIFIVSFLLYHLPLEAVFYPMGICLIIGLIAFLLDYSQMKSLHQKLDRMKGWKAESLEEFPSQSGILEEDYIDILQSVCREYQEYQDKSSREYQDMVDYYSIWAHQIKTPIAAMRLNIQREDSDFARSIRRDLNRIERYVEMVLTFLRLRSENSDYVIKSYDLDAIVRSVIKGFSSEFIGKRLSLNYQPLKVQVVTDEKWLSFVLEQLLSNAVKYTDQGGRISIFLDEDRQALCIWDTGIGIAAEDLPRIFEKGYTGFNGRMDKKASGIGLYLCKLICDKLEHRISATSEPGKGSTFAVEFPNMTRM